MPDGSTEEAIGLSRVALDAISALVVVLDQDGRIVGFNRTCEETTGFAVGELMGKRLWEMLVPEEAAAFKSAFQGMLAGRCPRVIKGRWLTKDNTQRLIAWSISRMAESSGSSPHVVATGVDVTEHRRVEEALRASEELLRNVVSNAPIVLFALDRNGIFTLSEGKGLDALGLKPGEVVGQSVFELYRDAPEVLANIRQAMTGKSFRCTSEASGVTFDTWLCPLREANSGALRGIVGVAVDVTERKQTEERVRHRLELEKLVATLSARFINLGPDEIDGGIHYALRAIGEFAGVDRSYVFLVSDDGKTADNTHEWCAEGIEPQIDNLQGCPSAAFPWWEAKLQRFENIHIPRVADLPTSAEAERRALQAQSIQSLAAVPLISAGRIIGFLGFDSVRIEKTWAEEDFALLQTLGNVIVSALERKRAEAARRLLEEQLHQAQKMEAIGRLAGGVAHDFNNLLTVIKGYSALLLEGHDTSDSFREEIEKIWEATERAEGLTRQLLTFSRHRPVQPKVIEVNPLILDLGRMLRRLIGEDTELRITVDPGAGCVRADPGRIEQAILNLVVNARDAMPQGGKLTIATANVEVTEARTGSHGDAPPGSYVSFSVSDTGCGMSEEVRAHIFEPFFTTKQPGHGTGLGLATVYGIVKQAGGYISAESEVGRGTTITIYLPCVEEQPVEVAAHMPPDVSVRGTETVLLVEDEHAVRAFVRAALEPYGYRVLEAGDGAQALALCEERRGAIHLLLTDVVMPSMDGPALARRLALLHPETKVLYISGYPDSALTHRSFALGDGFLEKPFTPDALRRKVREVLDTPGSSA